MRNWITLVENLIRESAPRTMYHGTLKEYLPMIKKLGLEPMVGEFVSNFYDPSHEEGYEAERDALDPLVFAATKKDLQRCVNAIVHRLRDKRIPATPENIIAHGAIVVTRDTEDQFYHREREETRYEDHPTQVEPGDFYSYETIHPDYILTGKKLRDLLRRNKVDGFVSMRPPIRSVTESLDEGFEAELYHGTTEHFTEFDFDKITSRGPFGVGIYLSNDLGLGRTYSNGGDSMVVRVKLKKPYRVDLDDYWAAVDQKKPFRSAEGRQQLLDDGYDGVVVTQKRYVEVVAFRGADLEILSPDEQPIKEAVEMVSISGYNKNFKTLRDPSPRALLNFAKSVKLAHMRFLISDGHIWFWDAEQAVHQLIAACLGIDLKPMNADSTDLMTGVIKIVESNVFEVGHINGKGYSTVTMTLEQWQSLQKNSAWSRYNNSEIELSPCYDYMDL